MKRILFLVLLITYSIATFSQSTELLDEKNGFKSFKLNEPKQKIENHIELKCFDETEPKNPLSIDDNYMRGCKVLNNPDKKLFNFPINELYLKFDDSEKLEKITICLKIQTPYVPFLVNDFITLFGKYTEIEFKEEPSPDFGNTLIEIEKKLTIVSGIIATWKGKEVKLNLVSFYSGTGIIFTTEIEILSLKNKNKQQENYRIELQNGF